jgi:hypothetical protein
VLHSTSAKVRRLATALLAFVALGGGSAWFIHKYFGIEAQGLAARLWPTTTAQQVEVRQLRKIAGWFSLDCGHVRYRENADRAIACAEDALRARRRFYIAFDSRGFDSHGTTGLAANSEGAVYEVVTGQLTGVWGGYVRNDGRVHKPTIVLCQKAPFEQTSYPANRFLSCLAESSPE